MGYSPQGHKESDMTEHRAQHSILITILIIIETVCYWHKDRYTGRWDRTEKPEMNPDTPTN